MYANHKPAKRLKAVFAEILWAALCLSVLCLPGQAADQASSHILLKETHKAYPTVSVSNPYSIVDVDSDGFPEVVQGIGKVVQIFTSNQTMFAEIPALASPVSTISNCDMDGDGIQEILVATGETGAIYMYKYDASVGVRRLAQTKHIWEPTSVVCPIAIDNEPKKELLGATPAGIGYLYKQTSQGFFQLWRGKLAAEPVRFINAGDINGDGYDEAVVVSGKSQLSVIQYFGSTFRTLFETTSQSPVQAVACTDLDGDKAADIIAYTEEKSVSVYGWSEGAIRLKSQQPVPGAGGNIIYTRDIDGDGMVEALFGGAAHSLTFGRFIGSSLHVLGSLNTGEDVSLIQDVKNIGLAMVTASGRLAKVKLVPSDYVRLVAGGEEITPNYPPLIKDGKVYMSARDITALSGISVTWNSSAKLATLSIKGLRYSMKPDSTEYYISGTRAANKLDTPPLVLDGRLFIPIRALKNFFGYRVDWAAETRTLTIIGW